MYKNNFSCTHTLYTNYRYNRKYAILNKLFQKYFETPEEYLLGVKWAVIDGEKDKLKSKKTFQNLFGKKYSYLINTNLKYQEMSVPKIFDQNKFKRIKRSTYGCLLEQFSRREYYTRSKNFSHIRRSLFRIRIHKIKNMAMELRLVKEINKHTEHSSSSLSE